MTTEPEGGQAGAAAEHGAGREKDPRSAESVSANGLRPSAPRPAASGPRHIGRLGIGSRALEVVAAAVLLLLLVGLPVAAFRYQASRVAASGAVQLTARTPLHGGWSQRVIPAQAGKPLTIQLSSEDVTHGFYVPAFDVESGPIRPGTYRTITFTPDRPGRFRFYCNVLCSHQHGAMIGEIEVRP